MYPLGRQDLTQQGAGKSWVGVLPSSDLRSRAGKGGLGSRPDGWGRRLKVGDSDGGSKDRVERQCRAGWTSLPLQRRSSLPCTGHDCLLSCSGMGVNLCQGGDISGEPKERQACLCDWAAQSGCLWRFVGSSPPNVRFLTETGPRCLPVSFCDLSCVTSPF